ncbi:Plant UBX domain-containing protein 7 [Glycine max]|nr:Plant UBX domain-containing protein 7 [Glycine max]
MEGVLSANEQQSMVSSFLEVAQGQTAETARQFLQATSWKLEEALQLFLIGSEGGAVPLPVPPPPLLHTPPLENVDSWTDQQPLSEPRKDAAAAASESIDLNDAEEVRPPLPVIRETLYDDAMLYGASRASHRSHEPSSLVAFRNFEEEMRQPGVWESEQGAASTAETSRDNLASLYRPPFHLMFNGPFDKAKDAASVQNKWLLVNIQSTKEFSSHMLNRDTWANEAVSQTISTNCIFWQDVLEIERTGPEVDIFQNQNTMELGRQLEGEPWQHSKPYQTEQLLLRKPKQWVLSVLVTMLLFVTKERDKKPGEALNKTRTCHSSEDKEEGPKEEVYDDTTEGRKVCTYYRLDSIPVVLVIDPITGQKMRSWIGMVQPESLLEGLLAFLDAGPKDHHITLSHKRPRGSSSPPKSKDLLWWKPDTNGVFTTKSAYKVLQEAHHSDREDNVFNIMWNLKIPQKLPTRDNLRKRQVTLPSYICPLCDHEEETIYHLMFNCEKTRSLWWETMRWVNRVGPYSIDPKNHFLQFTQWNSKDSTNKAWEFLWLALSFSIWYHRNAKIFKNQQFSPEKVMDDALFHTWSWIKSLVESDENKEEDEEVQRALAASMESMKESTVMTGRDNIDTDVAVYGQQTTLAKRPIYPALPEEPKVERNLLCRVGVRLPDGHRIQRNFLRTDPIQLLWSFISAQLGEDERKPFRLTHAIPGASKILDYESNSTFQESGLANSMISICDSHLYDPVFHLFMRLFNFKEKVIETFFVYRLYESE